MEDGLAKRAKENALRRPVVVMAISFSLGIAAGFYLRIPKGMPAVGIILAALGMFFIFFVQRKRRGPCDKKEHCEPCGAQEKDSFCSEAKLAIRAALILLCFFAGILNLQIHTEKEEYFVTHAGESISFLGTVTSIEKKDEDYFRLTVQKDSGEKILISLYGDYKDVGGAFDGEEKKSRLKNYGDLTGRTVKITATPELPASRRNPNCFDYRRYLLTKGIGTISSTEPAAVELYDITSSQVPTLSRVTKIKNKILNIVAVERADFIERITASMNPDAAGLVIGMVLGDKNELSDDTYELFQKNGTAHILAVSGIHIGILYACVYTLLGKRKNLAVGCASLAVLFCYAAFAMWAPSVMRAVSMIALHILSELLHRRYDMLCAGAFCASVMLLKNPMSLFDLGFQLSYMAIFVLAVIFPLANHLAERALARPYVIKNKNKTFVAVLAEKTIMLFLPAFVLQLGMIPITAYTFNYFSLAAFFVNVPVIYLAGFTVPLGIILAPLLKFAEGSLLTGVAETAEELLCGLLIKMNRGVFLPGLSYGYVTSPPLWLLFCYYGLIFFLTSETAVILWKRSGYKVDRLRDSAQRVRVRGKYQRSRAALGGAIIAVLLLSSAAAGIVSHSSGAANYEKAQLTFVDVGQGDCLHIRTPSGKNILIDGGGSANYDVGKKTLLPYLLKNGVKKLDLVFVTHRHTDHYAGIMSLAHELEIEKLALYEANSVLSAEISEETGMDAGDILYLSAGMRVDFEDGVAVEVVSPEKKNILEYEQLTSETGDENAISMVLKVDYLGVEALMTADIDTEGEKGLLERGCDLKADILKVAHHGSKYSSDDDFLRAVSPDVAVVQVGKNTFGHPTQEALLRISDAGADIYRNDIQGAICVYIKEGRIEKICGVCD